MINFVVDMIFRAIVVVIAIVAFTFIVGLL